MTREQLKNENTNYSEATEMKLRKVSFSHYPYEINK